MKRSHRYLSNLDPGSGGNAVPAAESGSGKSRTWADEEKTRNDAGNDELLAVLGYKVRSTEMAEVAQRLEQLEQAMGTIQEDNLTSLVSETVHYNPSDLSGWLRSILSELDPSQIATPIVKFDQDCYDPSPDYDLKAIPGKAVLTPSSPSENQRELKRVKSELSDDPNPTTRPVVVVDPQENGVLLVHTLMACAEAIQQSNLVVAEALVKQIGLLAASQGGAMGKVATHFAEALVRRINGCFYPLATRDENFNLLELSFYETCPYLKFAHFTANQAILEAFNGKKKVHVVDFSLNNGLQWPALLQALAFRPGGPPKFKLTGVGPGRIQETGWKLAQLAEAVGVPFEYCNVTVNSLDELDSSMLNLEQGGSEAVAVNSVLKLHRLLGKPGAFEKVMTVIRAVNPVIVAAVEQEANHNSPVFLDRFEEALHYYSTMFDSLEGCAENREKLMSETYLGRQIHNVVACEGADRVERHERVGQWRTRFVTSGFEPVPIGSNAFKQASMLLALYAGGDSGGYRVEESDGCLKLGWHTRPLIAASAWKLGPDSSRTSQNQ